MAAYSDLPEINVLYEEQAMINAGLTMLDDGGTVSMFTVSPPVQIGAGGTAPIMPVRLSTVSPTPALLTEVRNAMIARHNAISTQLIALGIADAPPVL